MDREGAGTWSERAGRRRGPGEAFVLPSRARALSRLATALDAGEGPVLVSGEPGVGKTWVCQMLRDRMSSCWRWAAVDVSPVDSGSEFLRSVLHAVGAGPAGGPADSRVAILEVLRDGAEDGERWGLIVDEGQNASTDVLEELRILGNRLGEPGSFAGLVLAGQNSLGRRLTTRPLASLRSRIATAVHLRPLDVGEVLDWLTHLEPGRAWDEETAEWVHRETSGNPRKVILLGGRLPVMLVPKGAGSTKPTGPAPVTAVPKTEVVRPPTWETPPVAPVKPPLRVGDGMIEVGWEPTVKLVSEAAPSGASHSGLAVTAGVSDVSASPRGAEVTGAATEEVIDDHYAALQAWGEWARNQGREDDSPAALADPIDPDEGGALSHETILNPDENPAALLSGLSGVRAESQHEFAPFGQLFSRLRQPRDTH